VSGLCQDLLAGRFATFSLCLHVSERAAGKSHMNSIAFSGETPRLSVELPPVLIDQIAEAVAARLTGLDSTTTQSPWLDVDGAAAYLNSTRDVVRRWASQQLLPGYQPHGPGSRWYFHPRDLDEFVRTGSTSVSLEVR
jgi:excisionase family DNA binding protein